MSRCPWLAEAASCSVEMSMNTPQSWVYTTPSYRSTPCVQAKALSPSGCDRIPQRHEVHHVGMPWHWGYKGIAVGDVVNNLSAMVGDPNVSIHEAKVFVCNVSKVRVA